MPKVIAESCTLDRAANQSIGGISDVGQVVGGLWNLIGVQLARQPPEGLVARALMPVRQVLVASADYLAAAQPIHAPQDLAQQSCLFLGERARDNQWRFVREGQPAEVTVQGRYAANHTGLRLDAALRGFGIAQLPDFVAREALRSGTLLQGLPDWDLEASYAGTAYLLFPPNRHLPPKVRVLVDFLVEACGVVGASRSGQCWEDYRQGRTT